MTRFGKQEGNQLGTITDKFDALRNGYLLNLAVVIT